MCVRVQSGLLYKLFVSIEIVLPFLTAVREIILDEWLNFTIFKQTGPKDGCVYVHTYASALSPYICIKTRDYSVSVLSYYLETRSPSEPRVWGFMAMLVGQPA